MILVADFAQHCIGADAGIVHPGVEAAVPRDHGLDRVADIGADADIPVT